MDAHLGEVRLAVGDAGDPRLATDASSSGCDLRLPMDAPATSSRFTASGNAKALFRVATWGSGLKNMAWQLQAHSMLRGIHLQQGRPRGLTVRDAGGGSSICLIHTALVASKHSAR